MRRVAKHWRNKPDVIVYPDGRERCNPATAGGRVEYKLRLGMMWMRQKGICCGPCRKSIALEQATFEHENGRNAVYIDERIEVDGKLLNGASCFNCNHLRGSKRTQIWHGEVLDGGVREIG